MGKDLDLDDVSYDHPYAKQELADMRSELDRLRAECAELRELADAAYDVVVMLPAQGPASAQWKKDWLEKARKHGASCDA